MCHDSGLDQRRPSLGRSRRAGRPASCWATAGASGIPMNRRMRSGCTSAGTLWRGITGAIRRTLVAGCEARFFAVGLLPILEADKGIKKRRLGADDARVGFSDGEPAATINLGDFETTPGARPPLDMSH